MASLKIDFEKGGAFTARLLLEEAPKTCKAITSRLPFDAKQPVNTIRGEER